MSRFSFISRLARRPDVAAWWHRTKNGKLRPSAIHAGSHRRVWWQCPKSRAHVWLTTPSGHKASPSSCLAARFPKLAREWHREKNGKLRARDVVPGSARTVWWRCATDRNHEWQEVVNKRASGRRCPFCYGRSFAPHRRDPLALEAPDLAAEWHPTKNNELTPRKVTPGSHKRAWWRCARDPRHEWSAQIHGRRGCPICYQTRRRRQATTRRVREVVRFPRDWR